MAGQHICRRDPDAGSGSCPFWWESCAGMNPPPIRCFSVWANQHGSDVYAWRDPWLNPWTGQTWPPPPAGHA